MVILADRGGARKPFPPLGACIGCGTRISLVGSVTTCPICSAWRRWYSAFRVASQALREAAR